LHGEETSLFHFLATSSAGHERVLWTLLFWKYINSKYIL